MKQEPFTIEQMIAEGSRTTQEAMEFGYRWEAVMIGGDALAMRQRWLRAQAQ